MANAWKLWKDCEKCHGDGVVLDIGFAKADILDVPSDEALGKSEIQCPACKGAKRFLWGRLEEELTELP